MMTIQILVSWIVTSRSDAIYYITKWRHNPEDHDLNFLNCSW